MLTLDVKMPIKEALRKAIEQSLADGKTLYQIAREASVDFAALSRWKSSWDTDNERDLRVSTAEGLMKLFGLKVSGGTPSKKSPPKRSAKK
jgi:transposase-like protein